MDDLWVGNQHWFTPFYSNISTQKFTHTAFCRVFLQVLLPSCIETSPIHGRVTSDLWLRLWLRFTMTSHSSQLIFLGKVCRRTQFSDKTHIFNTYSEGVVNHIYKTHIFNTYSWDYAGWHLVVLGVDGYIGHISLLERGGSRLCQFLGIDPASAGWHIQGGAPKIAKLVYKSHN